MNSNNIQPDYKAKANQVIQDIYWILDETGKHQTIDTVAKKFFINSSLHSKLFKLKRILIILFLFEQKIPNSLLQSAEYRDQFKNLKKEIYDKRYDTFLATIINNKIDDLELHKRIKIITWNYDIQFEIALKNYLNKPFSELQEFIQSIPNNKTAIKDNFNSTDFNFKKFGIVRLNGLAIDFNLKSTGSTISFVDKTIDHTPDFLSELINLHSSLNESDCDYYFNYSWEYDSDFVQKDDKLIQKKGICDKICQNTDILVIIGYSFPIFNRKVDKELLDLMGNVRRIYIQDLSPEGVRDIVVSLKAKNSLFNEEKISLSRSTNQFIIPYELDL